MSGLLGLSPFEMALLGGICFAAGLVRGFSGFALSALVMASAATLIAPIELIPILWFLEMSASLQMARGGFQDANRTIAILLVVGNFVGWPIGLSLTTSLPGDTSSLIALIIILALAALQLGKLRIPGLASRTGTLVSGVVAGLAAGIAHVGGMVVALYVLSQNQPARTMRGTLVVYLFLASFGSLFYLFYFGVMTQQAAVRALVLIPITMLGVWAGTKFFNPKWERYYRPFCLSLLMFLASVGLLRLGLR
ncbi:MAG: sulfite exporter TauE/SafE family protein [Pseudomonadota bacterium]